jgi:hypothetical protein
LSGQRTFSASDGGVIIETFGTGEANIENSAACYSKPPEALCSALKFFKENNELDYGVTRR